MTTIYNRLKLERKRLGFTQDQMASFGGVKRGAQINYESGERSPDGNYLAAIAMVGADVGYILTGTRTAKSQDGLSQRQQAIIELVLQLENGALDRVQTAVETEQHIAELKRELAKVTEKKKSG